MRKIGQLLLATGLTLTACGASDGDAQAGPEPGDVLWAHEKALGDWFDVVSTDDYLVAGPFVDGDSYQYDVIDIDTGDIVWNLSSVIQIWVTDSHLINRTEDSLEIRELATGDLDAEPIELNYRQDSVAVTQDSYFYTSGPLQDKSVTAVDLASGDQQWTKPVPNGHLYQLAQPAVYTDTGWQPSDFGIRLATAPESLFVYGTQIERDPDDPDSATPVAKYALDVANGETLWEVPLDGPMPEVITETGKAVHVTPYDSDGSCVLTAETIDPQAPDAVISTEFSFTQYYGGEWQCVFNNSAPVVTDTTLFVQTEDNLPWAVDADTGETVWLSTEAGQPRHSEAGWLAYQSEDDVAAKQYNVTFVNTDEPDLTWRYTSSLRNDVGASISIDDNHVIIDHQDSLDILDTQSGELVTSYTDASFIREVNGAYLFWFGNYESGELSLVTL